MNKVEINFIVQGQSLIAEKELLKYIKEISEHLNRLFPEKSLFITNKYKIGEELW